MSSTIRIVTLTVALIAPACGGRVASPAPAGTPSNVLALAGNYPTRATVIASRNTCDNVTVEDHPTTVSHTAGATAISLTHAGSTYSGTVDSSGRFSTLAVDFAFPQADYSISLSGQFSTSGFTATVELTKRASGRTCTYAVGWVGTKQGAPNTIPG